MRFNLAISSWRHGISDYLMFLAVVSITRSLAALFVSGCAVLGFGNTSILTTPQFLNATANILGVYSTREGQGRVDADPFWTPEHKRELLHLTYASQVRAPSLFLIIFVVTKYLTPTSRQYILLSMLFK